MSVIVVTGVQTCALQIIESFGVPDRLSWCTDRYCATYSSPVTGSIAIAKAVLPVKPGLAASTPTVPITRPLASTDNVIARSEERRVGKECSARECRHADI